MHAAAETPRRRGTHPVRKGTAVWSRRLHSWTSMVTLLVVFFFALTGLTLNHPDWISDPVTRTATGTLPPETLDGDIDYLAISEYLREHEGVGGTAGDHGVTGHEGHIAWSGPSYEAAVFFDIGTGEYTLTQTSYGAIAWLNDLHKGRNTSTAWAWIIDASAVFLAFVAATGLVLQLTIKRKRRTAVWLLAGGAVLTAAAMILA